MAEYTFWKFKWAYNAADPAVTFVKAEGTGYYSGYSASGAFRGSYLKAAEPTVAAPVVAQPAAPEPINQKFAGWGKVIPISMGQRRMSPQIIWLRAPVSIGVTATMDFAVSWGYNADDVPEDTIVTALYANATLIWTLSGGPILPGGWSWTYYPGTEEQMPDPTMVAANGAENTPAYRNQLVGVFRNFPLANFGFQLPGISAEITGSGGEAPRVDTLNIDDKNVDVLLSNGDLTATKAKVPNFDYSTVRSGTSHRRGQYYVEMTIHSNATYSFSGQALGFCLASASLGLPDVDRRAIVWTQQGTFNVIGAADSSSASPAPVDGDTIAAHIDMTNGLFRARNVTQGGAWSAWTNYIQTGFDGDIDIGDPLYVSVMVTQPDYPWGMPTGQVHDSATVNFGAQAFVGAVPAGATSWNGDGGTGDLLGVLPLRDFISKISTYCGLVPETDLDFEGIDDVIHGGLITRDTTFSDFLTVLGRAFGFDFYEGEQIRIVRRVIGSTYTIDKVIPREDLIVETDRSIQTTRRDDDAPTEIELSYIDRTQQFRWNIQKARRILFPVKTTRSIRKDAFAIPIITLADNALTMAGRALYREAMQNVDHDASMLPRHIAVEPSDILTITAGDTEYTVKVVGISMNADGRLQFSAVNLLTDEDMAWTADAGSPNLPYAGDLYFLDATEGADRFTGSQGEGSIIEEGADVFTGSTFVSTLSATEGADVATGAGNATGDTYWASVVLLIGFNGADAATSATDEKAGKALTFVGNAKLVTAVQKFDTASLYLDGAGDRVTAVDSDDFTFPGEFTIEAWVRPDATANGGIIAHTLGTNPNQGWKIEYHYLSATQKRFRFDYYPTGASSGVKNVIQAYENIDQSVWHHVAAVRDSGGTLHLFVDGVEKGTAIAGPGSVNVAAPLLIGWNQTEYFKGWIDEVRVTKGVCRYTANFTPPTAAFPRS